jgi:hypothetical protein
MESMKNTIAILILAHHNPEQLGLLIEHLCPDFDVFVQIDKKSALTIEGLPVRDNVHYYKEIPVFWGHVSQIWNMKFILEKAYALGYDRYCYISGEDFPIKSNSYIQQFFDAHADTIYMYANPLPIATWGFNKGFDRLDRYWFMKFNHRPFVKVLGRATLIIQRILGFKIKRYPLAYYAGSNWLNLTHESVAYLFHFLEQNPKFIKKLKHSRATDEIWVQSVLMNSPLKEKIVNDDLRYIDWTTGPEYPRILDKNDISKIENSEALFARKFKNDRDEKFFKLFIFNLNQ